MLRSSIARGLSEEHLRRSPPPRPSRSLLETDALPTYDPHSDIGKKVAAWTSFSEYAIHFIPAIVVLCAALLWFVSDPGWTSGVWVYMIWWKRNKLMKNFTEPEREFLQPILMSSR